MLRDALVAGIEDPAEVFAVSFRMTGRLQRQAAQAAGRFEQGNPDLALMSAGGALLGLLQLLDSDPAADADELSDEMTYHVLRMFGLTKVAARKLCSGPLPGQPQI